MYELKSKISGILLAALAGYTDDYKVTIEGHSYIQWARVEEAILHEVDVAVDEYTWTLNRLVERQKLICDWAANQTPPANPTNESMTVWLKHATELHNRMLLAGGVDPPARDTQNAPVTSQDDPGEAK